jgi:membrane fusion protein, multidrug efflux system
MLCRQARTLAVAVLTGLVLSGCEKQQEAAPPPGANAKIQVSVLVLHPRTVAKSVDVPGRTVAALVADVRPQVNGILKERLFKEGTEVKAGDLLYQIDPAVYQATLDSAVAAVAKSEAAVTNAQLQVNRYQVLITKNAGTQQDLDNATSTLLQAKADLSQAQADVEMARINLGYTKITAPITGRIDASVITPGALLTANQSTALATIRQLDPINVDVTDSATNLLNTQQEIASGKLKLTGPNITVKLVLDNGTTYPHNGTVSFLESSVSETTGTFTARAQFPNPDRTLLPGMYVRAVAEIGLAPNSFVVPQRAVAFTPQGQATAFFVDAGGKVTQRVLTIGQNVGNGWQVTNGVADGDRVVVEGNMLVRDGQEVAPIEVTVDDATGDIKPLSQSSMLETVPNASMAVRTQSAN